MNSTGIGIIGSGGMASRRAANFNALEGTGIRAVAARNPQTGKELAQHYNTELASDWRELVKRDDIDAIVITTHNEIHGEIALASLAAGKHVFSEYPIARHPAELKQLEKLLDNSDIVLRVAHRENVSEEHKTLKERIHSLGGLLTAQFIRLTPGRGKRPEVLFNLNLSGPPALFFIYHVYPLVDLFGPVEWVECGAVYDNLKEDSSYERFANTLNAGFEDGGMAQWTWAGGIEIKEPEEYQRIILTGGTLIRKTDVWHLSTRNADEPLVIPANWDDSLEEQFLREIRGQNEEDTWRSDARQAIEAALVGLAGEVSANEKRRVFLDELRN